MAELVGIISAGVGIAAFALQLGESIVELKRVCQDVRTLPEDIKREVQSLEVLSEGIKAIEPAAQRPYLSSNSSALKMAIEQCRFAVDDLSALLRKVQSRASKKSFVGPLRGVMKRPDIEKLWQALSRAIETLQLIYDTYCL